MLITIRIEDTTGGPAITVAPEGAAGLAVAAAPGTADLAAALDAGPAPDDLAAPSPAVAATAVADDATSAGPAPELD